MTKIEYSDFYKFLSSLGLVLISLALILPWLFLREPFDISISVSDLANLTPIAQSIINVRQETALWFLQNIKWISILLSVAGIAFLSTGITLWVRKQQKLDHRDDVELAIKEIELEKMTPTQILEKAVKEIQEVNADEKEEKPTPIQVSQPLHDYLRIENSVINKLTQCFGQDSVLSNSRIKDTAYDVILFSSSAQRNDVLFEIKVSLVRFDRSRVYGAIHQISASLEDYQKTTQRKAAGIVLLLLSSKVNDETLRRNKDFIENIAKEIDSAKTENIQLILTTEEAFINLSSDEMKALIYPARYGTLKK